MNTFTRVINPKLVDSRPCDGHLQVALGRTPAKAPHPTDIVDDEHRPLFFTVDRATDWPVLKATLLGWLAAHLQAAGVDFEQGRADGDPTPTATDPPKVAWPAHGPVTTFCTHLNPAVVEICENPSDLRTLSLGFPTAPLTNAVRIVLAPRCSAAEARTALLLWLADHLQACGVQVQVTA